MGRTRRTVIAERTDGVGFIGPDRRVQKFQNLKKFHNSVKIRKKIQKIRKINTKSEKSMTNPKYSNLVGIKTPKY